MIFFCPIDDEVTREAIGEIAEAMLSVRVSHPSDSDGWPDF